MVTNTRSRTRQAEAAMKLGKKATQTVNNMLASLAQQGVSVIISPPDAPVPPHHVDSSEMPLDGLELTRCPSWGSDLTTVSELDREMEELQKLYVDADKNTGLEEAHLDEPSMDAPTTSPHQPAQQSSQHGPSAFEANPIRRVSPLAHFGDISSPDPTDMSVDEYCSPRPIPNYPDAQWTTIESKNGGKPACRITLVPDDLSQAAKDETMAARDSKAWQIAKRHVLRMFKSARMRYEDVLAFVMDEEVRTNLKGYDNQHAILLPGACTSRASSSSTLVRSMTEPHIEPPSSSTSSSATLTAVSNRFLKVTDVPVQIIDGNQLTHYTDGIGEDGCWDAPAYVPVQRTATLIDTDMMVD